MTQEQNPISSYHNQNNILSTTRGVSNERRGLNEAGMASSLEVALQQVKEKQVALDRAKEDRADLDDTPSLSENSSINLDELPTTQSEEDLKYFDDEIKARQDELDSANERVKHFQAIAYLKEMISYQEGYLQDNKAELQKAIDKRNRVKNFNDQDFLDLAEKKVKDAQADVDEMELELEGKHLILPIFEAGTLTNESWKKIGEVIRSNPAILKTQVEDILVRFREKGIFSQKRDIKDLLELRKTREVGGLDKKQDKDINLEIRAIEISLSKYGVDVRDEDALRAILGEGEAQEENSDDAAVQETINTTDTEGDDEAESVENTESVATANEKFVREFKESVNKLISDSTKLLDKIKQNYTVELGDEFDDLVELYNELEEVLDKRQNLPEFDEFDELLVEADELLDEIDKLVSEDEEVDEGDDDGEQEDEITDDDEPEEGTPTEEVDSDGSDIPAPPEVNIPTEKVLNRIMGRVRRVFTGDFWSQAGKWISDKTRGLRNAFNEDSLLVNRNNVDGEDTREEEEVSMYDQIDNLLTELEEAFEAETDDNDIQELINQIQEMIDQNQADLGNDASEKLQKRLDELSGKEDEDDHSEVDGGGLPKAIEDKYSDFDL